MAAPVPERRWGTQLPLRHGRNSVDTHAPLRARRPRSRPPASWRDPLDQDRQLLQILRAEVGAACGCHEEWVAILLSIGPWEGNRDDLPIGILTIHHLPAPATAVAEEMELLTGTGMERMGDTKLTFQLVHNGCIARPIPSRARAGCARAASDAAWLTSRPTWSISYSPKPATASGC